MRNARLAAEKKLTDDLFDEIGRFSGDPFMKSLLAQHLCIRVSGFVQNCVRIVFLDYASPRTKDHVTPFVANKLKKFPNATWSTIIELANDFSEQWANDLKQWARDSRKRGGGAPISSLDSINVNRNAIAHGETSDITLSRLLEYYGHVLVLIEKLEEACV